MENKHIKEKGQAQKAFFKKLSVQGHARVAEHRVSAAQHNAKLRVNAANRKCAIQNLQISRNHKKQS